MGGRDQQGPARHPPEVPVAADDPSLLKEDGWRRTGEEEGEGRGGEGRGGGRVRRSISRSVTGRANSTQLYNELSPWRAGPTVRNLYLSLKGV